MAEVSGGDGIDDALRKMARRLATATEVRVGFLEGATYPDGTKVATVAALQNFGAPAAGMPPRPFFSNMIAAEKPKWGERFMRVLKAANYDAEKSLELMGEGIAGQLREAIIDFEGEHLSAVTVLLRSRFPMRDGMTFADVLQAIRDVKNKDHPLNADVASDKPLVWSGHMLASVDKEVE